MEYSVDLGQWPRKEIFDFFSRVSNPFYAVTFRQDVTELRSYCKAHHLSFYYGLIYLCCKAMEEVPEFRCRIRGENIIMVETPKPSFTDLKKGSDLFYIVTMPCADSMDEFCENAREKSSAQKAFIDPSGQMDDLIYFSCLPWMDITAVTNERDLLSPGAKDDSIPRICWGKYTDDGERTYLGISVEVNHRLIDGVHIGKFAQALTRRIEALGNGTKTTIRRD